MICEENFKLNTNVARRWNHRLPHLQGRWATLFGDAPSRFAETGGALDS